MNSSASGPIFIFGKGYARHQRLQAPKFFLLGQFGFLSGGWCWLCLRGERHGVAVFIDRFNKAGAEAKGR